MKKIVLFILLIFALVPGASALDFNATKESAWKAYCGSLPSFPITDSALQTAIEWRVFNGNVPRVDSATPYGIQLKRWSRTFTQFGVAAVAEDYHAFLLKLRAELEKTKK